MQKGNISHDELQTFAADLLRAGGADSIEANVTAEILVWTDLVGRESQGVWRLKELLPRLRQGLIKSPCAPEFIQKSDVMLTVDAHDGLGRFVGQAAMAKAIGMAGDKGMGLAAVRNSSHFGAGAYYVQMAAQKRMIGFAFSNTPRRVAAYGGVTPLFGTNPIAFGAPLPNGESVLVDLATSTMAGSSIRKGAESHQSIPAGMALDENGATVTDPNSPHGFALLPFGGAKGYCLSLMVEILSSVITGSHMSFQIPSMLEGDQPATHIGQLFLAMDIEKLLPLEEYYGRMEMLLAAVGNSAFQPGFTEVLIPGKTRWKNYLERKSGGIPLDAETVASLNSLATEMKVPTPW